MEKNMESPGYVTTALFIILFYLTMNEKNSNIYNLLKKR